MYKDSYIKELQVQFERIKQNYSEMEEKFKNEYNGQNDEIIFLLKSEVNLWKNAFLEIVRFKQLNYDENFALERVLIDKNYITNAPIESREKVDEILHTFKNLIEDENFQTSKS